MAETRSILESVRDDLNLNCGSCDDLNMANPGS